MGVTRAVEVTDAAAERHAIIRAVVAVSRIVIYVGVQVTERHDVISVGHLLSRESSHEFVKATKPVCAGHFDVRVENVVYQSQQRQRVPALPGRQTKLSLKHTEVGTVELMLACVV